MRHFLILLALLGSVVSPTWAWPWPFERVLPTAVAFAPDGTLYVGYNNGSLEHIALTPYALLSKIKTYDGAITDIVTCPNGHWIATKTDNGICVRDAVTFQRIGYIPGKRTLLAFRADGLLLVNGGERGDEGERGLSAWGVDRNGVWLARRVLSSETVEGASLSANGEVIFIAHDSASREPAGAAWDISRLRRPVLLSVIKAEGWGGFRRPAITDDGRVIVSFDLPHNPVPEVYIRIYDTHTGRKIRQIYDPESSCGRGIAFNPRGRLLASCGYVSEVETYNFGAWDITGEGKGWSEVVEPLPDEPDPNPQRRLPINSVSFSRDGRWLVAADDNGVYLMDEGKVIAKLR